MSHDEEGTRRENLTGITCLGTAVKAATTSKTTTTIMTTTATVEPCSKEPAYKVFSKDPQIILYSTFYGTKAFSLYGMKLFGP